MNPQEVVADYRKPQVMTYDDLLYHAERMAECLEQLPRWIPVSERLPEYLKVVATSDGTYVGAGFVHNDGQWILDHKTEMQSVTHWMPLPEPPKEVE